MEKGQVKSLRVLLVPVDWLLMDGCIFCIKRASVMDNFLWLNWVNNIFVLFTRSALVSCRLWLARACCFGPTDERCIVRRRERVVVVIPVQILHWNVIYIYLYSWGRAPH